MLACGGFLDIDGKANDDENAITLAEAFKMSYSTSMLSQQTTKFCHGSCVDILGDLIVDFVTQAHLTFRPPTNLRSSFLTDSFDPYRSAP